MGAPGFVTRTLAPTTSKEGEGSDDDGAPPPLAPSSFKSASAIRAASVSTSCARGPSRTTACATAWILL